MLDPAIEDQLRTVFAGLASGYTLVLAPSPHAQQGELRDLLTAVAATTARVTVVESGHEVPTPRFCLLKDGAPTGVFFRGIPGGHEFTSLVLAILNADGKGKLPDAGIQARVRALRGPLRLRTYVSLSCTNCPDVVQALNLVTLLHADCEHEMIDGGMAEDEIERLGVQGVPAVFAGDQLVHVGRADFAELLETLEEKLGIEETASDTATVHEYDVAVIGGGPAGVAAAIYTARKGLRVAVVAGRIGGQVQDTLGIENLISVTYTEGPQLAGDLRKHMEAAGVSVLENRTVEHVAIDERKELRLKGGERVTASTLIVATGAKWRELGVAGEKEYLGRGVAFCPHCDGPFYKGKRVAVIGGGNSGIEAAIDLAGICSHVTVLEFAETLRADAVLVKHLHALPNVDVITNARTTEVVGDGARVTAIKFENRATKAIEERALDGIFVQIGLSPNSHVVRDLVETNRAGEIVVDGRGRTSVPGVYAAGDVTSTPFKQIVIAIGEGAKAALTAFEDRMRAA